MSYTKTTWEDRLVEFPSRYTDPTGNIYEFTVTAGTITNTGTTITAQVMNNMESGIYNAYWQSESVPLENGVSVSLEYSSGNLTTVTTYTSASVTKSQSALAYNSGDLTTVSTIIYATDGTTTATVYTDSLSYTSGDLTNVSRSVT